MAKIDISPITYKAIQEEYERASTARREAIRRQYQEKGWTQQKIADFWDIDITRVNKIINSEDVEKGQTK